VTDRDIEIARLLKRRLLQCVELIDMRVFGSRARGDGDRDSDMDVFVEVASADAGIEKAVRDVAWETGFEYLMHISPVIFSREDVESSPMRVSPIMQGIRREGVVV